MVVAWSRTYAVVVLMMVTMLAVPSCSLQISLYDPSETVELYVLEGGSSYKILAVTAGTGSLSCTVYHTTGSIPLALTLPSNNRWSFTLPHFSSNVNGRLSCTYASEYTSIPVYLLKSFSASIVGMYGS